MPLQHDAYVAATGFIESWSRIILLAHERPDGDALGCLIALSRLLELNGKQVSCFAFGEVPDRYQKILKHASVETWKGMSQEELAHKFDGAVIVDTCARQQLMPVASLLDSRVIPILVLDHHLTRDNIADHYLIDEQASSSCLLVAEWAQAAGWQFDQPIAEALFSGMATDTGWFRFSNTDTRTLQVAGELLSAGVLPAELYESYYLNSTEGRLRVLGQMLADMTLHADGELAAATITQAMLGDCLATPEDCEELINEMLRIGKVDTGALFMEQKDGPVKVSLRSKHKVNVADIARGFGGGGHLRASGVRIEGEHPAVRQMIVQTITEALKG